MRETGMTDRTRRGMVQRSELVTVLPSVYRAAPTPLSRRGAMFAAVLWSGGAISHLSAAEVEQLGLGECSTIHVSVVDRVSRNGHPEFVRVHRVLLAEDDVEIRNGLRVTSRPRTVLDLVGCLPRREARALLGRAIHKHWLTFADVEKRLDQEKGRSGNVQLRLLAEEFTPGAQEEFERRFHQLLTRAGIEGWSPQYPITTVTGMTVHADVAFPAVRLLLELDGYAWHGGRERFGADRRRDRRTLMTGWRTARFTWDDLDHPAQTIAEILCLLAA